MPAATITAKPDTKVTGLSIKRTDNTFKATWKVPSGATKESSEKRWQHLHIDVYAHVYKQSEKKTIKAYAKSYDWGTGSTACSYSISDHLSAMYPRKEKGHYLISVTFDVYATNSKGKGPKASATYKMASPATPTLSLTFNAETNKINANVKAKNESNIAKQRHDSSLYVKRYGTGGTKVLHATDASTSTDRNWPCVIENADALLSGEYIRVYASSRNRGLRGNSAFVTRNIYIAHPTVPECGEPSLMTAGDPNSQSDDSILVPVSKSGAVTAKDANDKDVTVYPDSLKLQRLKNSLASTAEEAASAGGWQYVDGAEATGTCTGFTDTWADAVSDPGKRTWYRIVAEKDGYFQLGVPVNADNIFVPSESGAVGAPTLGTITSGTDGESVVVPVSWSDSSIAGVELTWSVYEDAWQSNKEPSDLIVDWGANRAATATIRGLETGTPVFIKARAYTLDSDGNKVFGGYSAAKMVVPYEIPKTVDASVPSTVESGKEIPVEWTFESSSPQQWADVLVDGVPTRADGAGHTVEGLSGATAISSDGMSLGSHTVSVVVSIDGTTGIESSSVSFTLADAPTGTISVTGTQDSSSSSPTYGSLVVTSQPVEFILTTSAPSPTAIISVIADGCAADEMHEAQPAGQVVWSGSFTGDQLAPPSSSTSYARTTDSTVDATKTYYTRSGNTYTKVANPTQAGLSSYYEYTGNQWAMKAPDGLDILDLRDWCGYSAQCTLTDGSTGLSTGLEPALFSVKWAHQAVEPGGTVTVDESDLSATITVAAPTGSSQTDVIDLYRVTPGGSYLIASGRTFGTAITDPYAPFKSLRSDVELRYRTVLRTTDGDMEFTDIPYELVSSDLRLDWDTDNVELPYNIANSDSFAKDFERRVHADGSAGGFWSPAVEHHGSLSTELIKFESAEQRESLMAMANHAGPVFVRTPDGMAYCANADLGSVDISYNSLVVSASIEATEVELTESFMAAPVVEGS